MRETEELRSRETALGQQASNLLDEAKEQKILSKLQTYKERYRCRTSSKEREADELFSQAESLVSKAQTMGRKA